MLDTRKLNPVNVYIGFKLSCRRNMFKLSLPELSQKTGISIDDLELAESGRLTLTVVQLWHICATLEAPIGFFMDDIIPRPKPTCFEVPEYLPLETKDDCDEAAQRFYDSYKKKK